MKTHHLNRGYNPEGSADDDSAEDGGLPDDQPDDEED
jgi:hypothetical protein